MIKIIINGTLTIVDFHLHIYENGQKKKINNGRYFQTRIRRIGKKTKKMYSYPFFFTIFTDTVNIDQLSIIFIYLQKKIHPETVKLFTRIAKYFTESRFFLVNQSIIFPGKCFSYS